MFSSNSRLNGYTLSNVCGIFTCSDTSEYKDLWFRHEHISYCGPQSPINIARALCDKNHYRKCVELPAKQSNHSSERRPNQGLFRCLSRIAQVELKSNLNRFVNRAPQTVR